MFHLRAHSPWQRHRFCSKDGWVHRTCDDDECHWLHTPPGRVSCPTHGKLLTSFCSSCSCAFKKLLHDMPGRAPGGCGLGIIQPVQRRTYVTCLLLSYMHLRDNGKNEHRGYVHLDFKQSCVVCIIHYFPVQRAHNGPFFCLNKVYDPLWVWLILIWRNFLHAILASLGERYKISFTLIIATLPMNTI